MPHIPLLVGYAIGYAVVIITTIIRLTHRFRRGQLWWDDLWASVSFVFTIFAAVLTILRENSPPVGYETSWMAFNVWASFLTQPTVVWSSRLSIQAAIISFLPPGRNRFISKCGFAGICIGWLTAVIARLFYNGIPIPKVPRFPWRTGPTIINLTLNILATVWLVGWPAYILSRMKLRKSHRHLFIACFSSTLLLLAADLFHAVNILTNAGSYLSNISAHLEHVLSAVVANILVLASFVYRVVRASTNGDGSSDDSTTKPPTKTEEEPRMVSIHNLRSTTASQSYPPMSTLSSVVGHLTTVYTSGDEQWSPGSHASVPISSLPAVDEVNDGTASAMRAPADSRSTVSAT